MCLVIGGERSATEDDGELDVLGALRQYRGSVEVAPEIASATFVSDAL